MNGARAEPLASTSNTPTSTSVRTIGASQYFLLSRMNCHSSLTTCAFDIQSLFSHKKAQKSQKNFLNQFCDFCASLWLEHLLIVARVARWIRMPEGVAGLRA